VRECVAGAASAVILEVVARNPVKAEVALAGCAADLGKALMLGT
jgi:hypothetical protein